jgi:acetyl esterase/lipase
MTTTVLRSSPSLRMRLVCQVLAARGSKRVLGSAEATEQDRLRNVARGVPAPRRRLTARHVLTETTVAGVPCLEVVDTQRPEPRRTIVYVHGGAYVNPPVVQHWDLVAALATENDARVVAPLYPLAPGGTAATVVPLMVDVDAAVRAAHGPRVVWAGDSAGGGLALAAAVALRDRGRALPDHLVLLAPWLDVTMSNPGVDAAAPRVPSLAVPGLQHAGRLWAGNTHPRDPLVSPGFADLDELPPTTVVVGDRDLFAPDCRELAERAERAGVDVSLVEAADGFHVFPAVTFPPESRAARRAISARLDASRHG